MKFEHLGFAALGLAVGLTVALGCARRATDKPTEVTSYATPTPVPELPTPVPTPVPNSYIVQRGDNLWDISAKPTVQGDNYRWPLLFKANRDQIIDPDLIEPAQDLTWKSEYGLSEVQDAVQKAKDTPPYVPHSKPRKQLPLKY